MFDALMQALPNLLPALENHIYQQDSVRLWADLSRLLRAHAPSGGAWLPGAISDDVGAVAASLGLGERFIPHLGRTGNAAVWLGADKPQADVIALAHMDRPSFRVRNIETNELYPMCALRIPNAGYQAAAKALRFVDGQIQVAARGRIHFEKMEGRELVWFKAESGQLGWYDTLVMEAEPTLKQGVITGTGLDNCLGVLTALGAAAALAKDEAALVAQGRRLLFVFTDLEEGVPEAYFGHGAARLIGYLPPPTFGMVCVDAQSTGMIGNGVLGGGGSFGTASAWSRGSFVAPNYCALGVDLAAAANARWAGTAQINRGYLSRSDDMPLGRWTQVLGMIGPVMLNAHTTEETAHLNDLAASIRWLALYLAVVTTTPEPLRQLYALDR